MKKELNWVGMSQVDNGAWQESNWNLKLEASYEKG
jgi:hypothetical protein